LFSDSAPLARNSRVRITRAKRFGLAFLFAGNIVNGIKFVTAFLSFTELIGSHRPCSWCSGQMATGEEYQGQKEKLDSRDAVHKTTLLIRRATELDE
jgi:nitrate/TMAO reductase-like tetraheme cytochrome c subunit